ncbi:hypothetical protein CCACVL1_07901 [Corchorus capsularis]|uniref:Uncharacterized protein n=1 Tax=Corchorus capsularis TaxID=210143 RepID=A0A1R3J3E0_COCAP|nr:hypothetical protein CCACVL1_07901 [Corchorus capsularis]
MEEEPLNGCPGVRVSLFDYSIENHFKAMETIYKLCGEPKSEASDETDIQRFSSSITFLREWRHFNYEPRTIRFASQVGNSQGKSVSDGINLPQFSSATVPKREELFGSSASSECCKDFVMYVGGSVWALDWCPRVHENPSSHVKCEFIAVAAHPPESYYHKMGTPVTGRGIVQIWCMLNVGVNVEEPLLSKKKPNQRSQNTEAMEESTSKRPRGRPRKKPIEESQLDQVKRPKGRPRKKPIGESLSGDQPLAIQYPEVSFEPLSVDSAPGKKPTEESQLDLVKRPKGRPRKKPIGESLSGDQPLVVHYTEVSVEPIAVDTAPGKKPIEESQLDHVKRPKGRPRKKPIGVSLSGDQPLVVQYTEVSLEPIAVDTAPGNKPIEESQLDQLKRPKGRSRKKPIGESLSSDQPLAVQYPEVSFEPVAINSAGNTRENSPIKNHHEKQKGDKEVASAPDATPKISMKSRNLKRNAREISNSDESMVSNNIQDSNSLEVGPGSSSIPADMALPRAVLCLAHNGKVAWDVKWRPYDINVSKCNQRMGYLAVLLGNGSLEVWEVPLPHMVRTVYSSSAKQGTDPRFVKLEPVFKCSKLKCGDIQSIPLTVEWSTSPPHDYLLAGCHDGMVALWKFSASASPKDTRPLLCFSADTVPIRSVAWAPSGSDMESTNVILTAGHGGLKFWDIRDPFLPLWDVHPAPKFIYSLDWLPEPRCVILSFDDGTMKLLSLSQAVSDVPVTGKPFTGTKQQGLHLYNCSSFAIWHIQVSRLTGMVAYCGADGTVSHFQLTSKAVDKDFSRNRAPHFLCGSLTEEESAIIINTPLPDIPLTMKKSTGDYGEGPRSMRAFLTETNQAKNAKDKKAKVQTCDKQTLALCYGDDPDPDPGVESDSEETLAALKCKKKQKSQSERNKKADNDQALAIRIEEATNTQKEETGNEIEVFPGKMVAMHRVRWNMNKGSERWLCYGGAAGIVRCQEIKVPDVDKKSARKG